MPLSPRLTSIAASGPLEAALAEEKAAEKAARKAAKEAQKQAIQSQEDSLAEEKAARKAIRTAAKEAEAEATLFEEKAAAEKAIRKAARKAAKIDLQTIIAGTVDNSAASDDGCLKRKACDNDLKPTADAKLRKCEDGIIAATKELGAASFRTLHEIVVASSCPSPFETFDAAAPSLGDHLAKALRAQGYAAPTPIQAQCWPIALTGQDMVAVAKTGSGKTCGFLLPALARIAERGPAPKPKSLDWYSSEPARPSVLVVAPTRELCLQIAGEAEKFAPAVSAKVVALYGGVPKGLQVGQCRGGADVVIATPGRLMDLLAGDPKRGLPAPISLEKVTYLVLDEADQMLDMGFEPDIRKIVDQCPKMGTPEEAGGAGGPRAGTKRQTLFFTATWPKKVQAIAASLTSKAALQVRIGQGGDGDKLTLNKAVTQEVVVCDWKQKKAKLSEYLVANLGPKESALVFAGTKGGCDFLEGALSQEFSGTWCRAIHGDKMQWEREAILSEYRSLVASGQRAVLIATDVASRGLDIPGIGLVVIYDFSSSKQPAGIAVESFVHRVGRTGRAGKTGRAFTLWTSEDTGAWDLIALLGEAGQKVPKELEEIAWYERPPKGARRNHGWAKKW